MVGLLFPLEQFGHVPVDVCESLLVHVVEHDTHYTAIVKSWGGHFGSNPPY